MLLSEQIIWLFILALPISCIAWTVTHEQLFSEFREYCVDKSRNGRRFPVRKFFYLFTCEYCFSHYVTAAFVLMTDYHLLLSDWRGYVISGFALVWIANVYMSVFAFIRQDIKKEKTVIQLMEKEQQQLQSK